MKSFLFLFCSFLLLTKSYGQNVFGFKVGGQFSKMKGFDDGGPKSLLPTVQVKGDGIIPISDDFTLNPSLGYSGKGYKWNDLEFTDQLGNPIGSGDVIGLFNYVQLTVPISYKIASDQNHEYYLGAGPYFSYAVSGKGKVKHAAIQGNEDSWDLFSGKSYKRTDAGVAIEVASRLNKKYMVAVNFDIGLSDVSNTGGGKLKQMAGGISIGYLFGKKS
jgi:hypothetical protein